MTVFLLDLPSSYLFVDLPASMALYATSAPFIGGLQWALVGALVDVLRKDIQTATVPTWHAKHLTRQCKLTARR